MIPIHSLPFRAIHSCPKGLEVLSLNFLAPIRSAPELLAAHSVRRAINVILQGDGAPYGILEVDSRSEGEFSEQDIAFLQGAANILGMAIERQRHERRLKEALEHQHVLVKEINHRVKNSLQLVSSMLSLQAGNDPALAQRLQDASSRIAAIARAHDRLYRSPQIEEIDLGGYLVEVCRDLTEVTPHCAVSCDTPEVLFMSTDRAIRAALVVTELVTNARWWRQNACADARSTHAPASAASPSCG
jgi:hypothetical protein